MGVAPVDFGDGRGPVPIDKSNAKMALQKRQELGLDTSQIKYAESFLTTEEKDEIFYSENESQERGKEKAGGVEGAEEHDGQGGNAAATSVGMAACGAGAVLIATQTNIWAKINGFAGLGWSAALCACAALAKVFAGAFDNGYDDRMTCKEGAEATNGELDQYTSDLEGTMDSMNEDMSEYQDAIDNYTASKNDNTNRQAETQMQIQDAEAMGDFKKVAELQAQLKGLGEADFSKEEEDMGEIKERLDEYSSIGDEAIGLRDGATTVSEFLKEGTALGIVALADAALLTIATAITTSAVYSNVKKAIQSLASWNFAEAACAMAASALCLSGVVLFGMATSTIGMKGKNELECGSAGNDMEDHISALNDMIGEQSAYVDQTTSDFGSVDQASAESQGEAAKKAGEATQKHGAIYKKPEEKDDDKTGAGSGSGGGGGNGNGKNA